MLSTTPPLSPRQGTLAPPRTRRPLPSGSGTPATQVTRPLPMSRPATSSDLATGLHQDAAVLEAAQVRGDGAAEARRRVREHLAQARELLLGPLEVAPQERRAVAQGRRPALARV